MVEVARQPADRRLLERARELTALDGVLAEATAGRGRCLVLEGAAGLGKSTLVAAARDRARAAGCTALLARGDELEHGHAFGVALQLVEPPVLGAAPERRDQLLRGAAELCRPLLERTPGAPGGDSFALFHGLHWLVAGLAEEGPLALLVDDAHWSDVTSTRFLHYLLHRLDELPVAVIVAARPRTGEHGLVARIAAHPLAGVHRLMPLSDEAVATVVRRRLGATADDGFCAACAHASGGNPFLLDELLGALDADGVEPVAESVAQVERLGGSVSAAVLARLAALPERASALAHAVAVLGDGASVALARELAGLDADAAATAADELASAAIFVPGAPLSFAHPLIREAVDRDLPPAAAARAHGRAASLLRRDGADAERIAAQLLVSDTAGEPWAVEALREAAGLARARGARRAAIPYLRAALHGPHQAEVLRELADVEARESDPEAPTRVRAALDATAPAQPRARAALRLGLALADGGEHREASSTFERGLQELGGGAHGSGEAAELAATLAATRAAIGGLDHAVAVLGGVEATLARTGMGTATIPERLMLAHAAVAAALRGTDAADVRRLARGALDGPPPQFGVSAVSAIMLASTALLVSDALEETCAVLSAAMDETRRRGLVRAFATFSHLRAHAHAHAGRLDEAIADAQDALEAARYGWDPGLPAAHAVLATCLVEQGEISAAQAALELIGGEERWQDAFTLADWLDARGRVRLALGRPAQALEDFEACGARLTAIGTTHGGVVPWRSGAARAAAAAGDHARAAELADADLEEARRFGAPRVLAMALRTAGVVAGGDAGIELLREAVTVAAGSEGRLEHAHALTDLGAALLDARHRLAARDALREGLDLAHRCGARALADRAHELLVASGARPRRREITGRDALTPREQRLAEMAASGLTNREIAESQFITVKTVETHLAHVFRKLGVRSRGELGEALTRRS